MVWVAVVRANELGKKDSIGKGDPYIVVKSGGEEKKTSAKSGANVVWDSEHFDLKSADKLYILHKDKDVGADSVVSFAAIDLTRLDQVTNGWFPLYNVKEEKQGSILLNIGKEGRPNSLPDERSYDSFIDDELRESVRKINRSAKGKDMMAGGAAILGGIGAGFLGKNFHDQRNQKKIDEENRQRQEEEQRQNQQREEERQKQQHEDEQRQQQQQEGQTQHQQGGAHQHGSTPGGGSAGNWQGNFVQYKTGQEVEYQNSKYRVLQSHSSQNDWAPDVASSLFQRV